MRKKSHSPSRAGRNISISNKGREELLELPQLSSLPDESKNYFIGGWSSFSDFTSSVTTVANKVKPANQGDEQPFLLHAKKIDARYMMSKDGEENEEDASDLPHGHKIIVLSGVVNNAAVDDDSSQTTPHVAQLTHGMTIMGQPPSETAKLQEEFDSQVEKKSISEEDEGDVEGEEQGNDSHNDVEIPEKKRYEIYYDDDEESEAVDEDGNPVIEKPTQFRKAVPINPDDLVIIRGPIVLEGIKPVNSADKELIQQKLTAAALVAGVPPVAVTSGGKPKRRTEEEKQREAETVRRLEAERLAAIAEEEERLKKFADPDRWPTVIISNLAFSGPVEVKTSHIHFSNCHFGPHFDEESSEYSSKNMVSVTQYCRVSFSECTFMQPVFTALYLFPTSECAVNQCIFSGLPQPKTMEEVEKFIQRPICSFKDINVELEKSHPDTVGIHSDSAKLTVRGCHFEALGTGVISRGVYSVRASLSEAAQEGEEDGNVEDNGDNRYGTSLETNDEGHKEIRVRRPHSVLTENTFQLIYKTSLIFVSAQRILAKDNSFAECGYYAIQCFGPTCTPQIIKSNVQGKVFIGQGASPFLHGNSISSGVVNKNDIEAVYLQRIY